MPKEVIYGDDPYGEDDPGVSVAEVRWGRDTGYMQLVTKVINRTTGGRYREELDTSPPHFTDGMYLSLDRKGINDLIRVLRRARDQAWKRRIE